MDHLAQFGDEIGALQPPLGDTEEASAHLRKLALQWLVALAGPLGGGPRLETAALRAAPALGFTASRQRSSFLCPGPEEKAQGCPVTGQQRVAGYMQIEGTLSQMTWR